MRQFRLGREAGPLVHHSYRKLAVIDRETLA